MLPQISIQFDHILEESLQNLNLVDLVFILEKGQLFFLISDEHSQFMHHVWVDSVGLDHIF